MILLPRAVARAFRALARKCHPGRPRGPAPPITFRQADGRLMLKADLGEVALTWVGPAAWPSVPTVFPVTIPSREGGVPTTRGHCPIADRGHHNEKRATRCLGPLRHSELVRALAH